MLVFDICRRGGYLLEFRATYPSFNETEALEERPIEERIALEIRKLACTRSTKSVHGSNVSPSRSLPVSRMPKNQQQQHSPASLLGTIQTKSTYNNPQHCDHKKAPAIPENNPVTILSPSRTPEDNQIKRLARKNRHNSHDHAESQLLP